jgi:hypothetical protein
MYNPDSPQSLEKYSSAVTLSDMEVFIFPELMYSLVLANCMSPLLWEWRSDPWFAKNRSSNEYRRIQRAKQFIMDRFVFNLDLDTWGLTTKQQELARFSAFVDESVLARSNALFGYEGDKYYFDIDIRRHFGLDKYTSDIIPYWKTETIEAMHAFRHKAGYPSGAGECVSLAALYASALFVLAGVSLDKIYMMATPLHSQNFIDVRDGILTNNRRIVTKNMWYNGTELSAKARRALQNERVTVVVHTSGYIHTLYDEATISPDAYRHFSGRLRDYLTTQITFETLASFLRQAPHFQRCFQLSHRCCGKPRFIEAEKAFHYEHGGKSRIGDATQTALLHEIDEDEYYTAPLPNRVLLDDIEEFFRETSVDVNAPETIERLKIHLENPCFSVETLAAELLQFCRIEPNLPTPGKKWTPAETIQIDPDWDRNAIVEYLESIRSVNAVADLAFTAYRDLRRAPWKPFLKAAFERNPVCKEQSSTLSAEQIADRLWLMDNESIYDGSRLAQPDEVWNFGRGDGLEKALCLMAICAGREPSGALELTGNNGRISVGLRDGRQFQFESRKDLPLPTADDYSGIIVYGFS